MLSRLLTALVLVALAASPAQAERVPEPGPAVTGYVLGDASPDLVAANAAGLTTLTVDGVTLDRSRAGVRRPTRAQVGLAAAAHTHGLRAELLVSNYSDRIGDFDTAAAGRLLGSPARVARLADALAGFVAEGGWDGVNVDLEALRRRDGAGLVALLTALRQRLPAPLTLSVDLSAATSPTAYRRAGYLLPEIAAQVDAVQLMAYDLHGPSWSGPGPVGPLGWQRAALDTLLAQVPAAKVDLGVAGYGYTWPRTGTGRTGRDVTVARARRLAARDGVTPRWHERAGEWSARLTDGTVLWWSDGRSWALRRQLAADLGLHGLALWRLGSADLLTSTDRRP